MSAEGGSHACQLRRLAARRPARLAALLSQDGPARPRRPLMTAPAGGRTVCQRSSDFNALGTKICNSDVFETPPLRLRRPPSRTRPLDRLREIIGMTAVTRARTRSWGSEASGAIPFPGADSVISSLCGTISSPLATARPILAPADRRRRSAGERAVNARPNDALRLRTPRVDTRRNHSIESDAIVCSCSVRVRLFVLSNTSR